MMDFARVLGLSSTTASAIPVTKQSFSSLPQYGREEVRRNADLNWIIIEDLVYDLTDFMSIHPGGMDILLEHVCLISNSHKQSPVDPTSLKMGLDATTAFEDVGHSKLAKGLMLRYVIGRVGPSSPKPTNTSLLLSHLNVNKSNPQALVSHAMEMATNTPPADAPISMAIKEGVLIETA